MGWAIQRQDGSYRGWYAAGKSDEALQPGESWAHLDQMPAITAPVVVIPPSPLVSAVQADGAVPKSVKDLLAALSAKLGV